MKEMTLREVQLFELDILKDVHEFCMANHINYSLAYGTLITAEGYEHSTYCGNRSILIDFPKDKHPRSIFDNYEPQEFEGHPFMIMSQYDTFLQAIYGDYMTPPPPEERVRHPQRMYWL